MKKRTVVIEIECDSTMPASKIRLGWSVRLFDESGFIVLNAVLNERPRVNVIRATKGKAKK